MVNGKKNIADFFVILAENPHTHTHKLCNFERYFFNS